ncbi:Immunoglobulin E-set,MD-2-related lipid-recognition domain [Cinara cedri]|uniref:Immunoglobulin E-set,MD-2-related lipid-recognition domain n=1 Tax=Cinara cedri TaxID=506608 RepID=A0A5E4MCQ2_9HEMI|nr:Immunoglobulin E-set,MD-2-related lipid-recognition domain [Cinara cedri]
MSFSAVTCAAVAVVGLIFATVANTEEVDNFRMCRNTHCEVFDVFVNPCPEALDSKPCELPQGTNASIEFKYIPKWGSSQPVTRLYAETLVMDLPFLGMDTNACLYTECPMVAQATQIYNYNLYISESYPKGGYTVKVKMWNGESNAKSSDECCFKIDIAIV